MTIFFLKKCTEVGVFPTQTSIIHKFLITNWHNRIKDFLPIVKVYFLYFLYVLSFQIKDFEIIHFRKDFFRLGQWEIRFSDFRVGPLQPLEV